MNNNEVYKALKNVLFYDAIIGFILLIVSAFFFKNYGLYILLGLLFAAINFTINALTLQLSLIKKIIKGNFIITLSYFIKILIIAIIGAELYKQNTYYLYAYLVGLLSHFIAMLLLGISLKAD
jgi:hypothetical protein